MSSRMRTIIITVIAVAALVPAIAVAGDRFNDVPDTNIFHDDIGWLADAGVTLGCNPPANDEFCPGDDVKREQMAAFMRRFAQYLDAEDGTPGQADNADLLDGTDSAVFANPVAGFAGGITNVGISDATNTLGTIDIVVPSDGFLVINAFVTWRDPIDTYLSVQLDDSECNNIGKPSKLVFATGDDEANVAATTLAEVTAGAHTLSLCAGEFTAEDTQLLDFSGMTAVFSNTEM